MEIHDPAYAPQHADIVKAHLLRHYMAVREVAPCDVADLPIASADELYDMMRSGWTPDAVIVRHTNSVTVGRVRHPGGCPRPVGTFMEIAYNHMPHGGRWIGRFSGMVLPLVGPSVSILQFEHGSIVISGRRSNCTTALTVAYLIGRIKSYTGHKAIAATRPSATCNMVFSVVLPGALNVPRMMHEHPTLVTRSQRSSVPFALLSMQRRSDSKTGQLVAQIGDSGRFAMPGHRSEEEALLMLYVLLPFFFRYRNTQNQKRPRTE